MTDTNETFDLNSIAKAVMDATPPQTARDLRRTVRDMLDASPSARGDAVHLCNNDTFTNADRVHYLTTLACEHSPELSEAVRGHELTPNRLVKLIRSELDTRYLRPLGVRLLRGRAVPLQITDQSGE